MTCPGVVLLSFRSDNFRFDTQLDITGRDINDEWGGRLVGALANCNHSPDKNQAAIKL